MEANLFSSNLEPYQGKIENERLKHSLSKLPIADGGELKIYSWDQFRIAVPLGLSVDIPPLGTYEGIDIRGIEPIILVFDLIQYPFTAPSVFTNRLDFPKDVLAHLYIAMSGKPPAFCYVRGSMDEWYSNKRIEDLLIRISNWLRDAATGELTQDGDQFEPVRLEGFEGVVIYDYDLIANLVQEDNSILSDGHFAVGLFEASPNGGFRLVKMSTHSNIKEIVDDFAKDRAKSDTDPNRKLYRFGYFLWSQEPYVFGQYDSSFPKTWGEFKVFCSQYKIDYEKFEEFYTGIDFSNYIMFPVVLAIKRPKQIIGFSSHIEFVNFRFSINTDEVVDGKISDAVRVKLSSHNQPLTTTMAKTIAGISENNQFSAMVFGCGALGSKITMHLVRSGLTNLKLIDPDDISPHNMVRHALLPEYEGQNKAVALASIIKRLYPTEKVQAAHIPFHNLPLVTELKLHQELDWVFDFTASSSFFSELVLSDAFDKKKVASAHISDFGDMGIFLREGKGRNPRVDDLRVLLYSQYSDDSYISAWLKREREATEETNMTVSVGVGCNSETTILSDAKVSLHAAIFAELMQKQDFNKIVENGVVLTSRILKEGYFSVNTTHLEVQPLDVFTAINDTTWSVRFKFGIIDLIREEMINAGTSETGGVFTGVANHKTKTIHVTGLITAPADSEANSVCFLRGHLGLADEVNLVVNDSGGQLGYVGEWHSHPNGPDGPSTTDMRSVQKFKKEFDSLLTPLPVFLTIVTQTAILPYVF